MLFSRLVLSFLAASPGIQAVENASNPASLYDYDVLKYIDPLIGSANGGIIPWYIASESSD